jgi:hypothetical protein
MRRLPRAVQLELRDLRPHDDEGAGTGLRVEDDSAAAAKTSTLPPRATSTEPCTTGTLADPLLRVTGSAHHRPLLLLSSTHLPLLPRIHHTVVGSRRLLPRIHHTAVGSRRPPRRRSSQNLPPSSPGGSTGRPRSLTILQRATAACPPRRPFSLGQPLNRLWLNG